MTEELPEAGVGMNPFYVARPAGEVLDFSSHGSAEAVNGCFALEEGFHPGGYTHDTDDSLLKPGRFRKYALPAS